MNLAYLNNLLEQFVNQNLGVGDAVLVSSDAELISLPVQGWHNESAVGMALAMFQMSSSTRENLNWRELEQIWLQGGKNHFIGIFCSHEILLLIKAGEKVTLGGLRLKVNHLANKIQAEIGYNNNLSIPTPKYFDFSNSIFAQMDTDILPGKTVPTSEEQILETNNLLKPLPLTSLEQNNPEPLPQNPLEKRPLLF